MSYDYMCRAVIVNVFPPLHRVVPAVVRGRRPPRYHTSVAHILWYYQPPFSYPTSSVTIHPPPTSHPGAVVYMHIPTLSYSYTPSPLIYSCSRRANLAMDPRTSNCRHMSTDSVSKLPSSTASYIQIVPPPVGIQQQAGTEARGTCSGTRPEGENFLHLFYSPIGQVAERLLPPADSIPD